MRFSYDIYYKLDCFFPLLYSAIAAFFLILALSALIKTWKCKDKEIIKRIGESLFYIFLIVLFINNVLMQAKGLLIGGLYLLTEKEESAVKVIGTIDNTAETDVFIRRKYLDVENNDGMGEFIFIDGERYYLMTYGDLQIGDSVVMQVLPKSRFVLEINKIPNGTESGG